MKDISIKGRIKEIVKNHGGNQSEFARKLGMNPSHLSMLMNSDTGISSTVLKLFADLGVDMNFLISGQGEEMFLTEGKLWETKYNEAAAKISMLEQEVRDANNLINSLERILKGDDD